MAAIYLCLSAPPVHFGSRRGILLPNLDFSLAGFTSFHPECFHSGFVTVALYGLFSWDFSFRFKLRRQLSLPGLIDSAGTNTTGITACASMDFPLTLKGQRLPEYARFLTISVPVILILFHDLLFEP